MTNEKQPFMTKQMHDNMRLRWGNELKNMSSDALAKSYEMFYGSEFAGSNDAKFLSFLKDYGFDVVRCEGHDDGWEPLFSTIAETISEPLPAINRVTREDVESFENNLDDATRVVTGDVNAIDYYAELALKSAIYPGKGTPFGLMYTALGLAEAGEVQGKVKKAFRDDYILSIGPAHNVLSPTYSVTFSPLSAERRQMIKKELGGLAWYFVATCAEAGLKPSEVLLENLIEIAGRTERGTLRGDGDNR